MINMKCFLGRRRYKYNNYAQDGGRLQIESLNSSLIAGDSWWNKNDCWLDILIVEAEAQGTT